MLRFGHFYLDGVFTLYDLSREQGGFVAALSASPRIAFWAPRPDEAVAALRRYMESLRWYDVHLAA